MIFNISTRVISFKRTVLASVLENGKEKIDQIACSDWLRRVTCQSVIFQQWTVRLRVSSATKEQRKETLKSRLICSRNESTLGQYEVNIPLPI